MRASLIDTSELEQPTESIAQRIVEAVATFENVDPIDLSEPVFEFIDPDALDAVVASATADTNLSITFEAWGHDIGVSGDGDVSIDGEVRDSVTTPEGTDTADSGGW